MSDFSHSLLDEYKTQAALLLKQIRSDDTAQTAAAAQRFQQLPHLQQLSLAEIVQTEVKLKHALQVLAIENNFDTWADFKHNLERKDRLHAYRGSYYTLHYPERCAHFFNEWHAHYEIASQELGRSDGYLLPYKNQFFICDAAYIQALGLDPDDPDWERIGWNWVEPQDQEAWQRLDAKLHAVDAQYQSGEKS